SGRRGYAEHAPLRILRARADRGGAFEFSASISAAAGSRKGMGDRGSGAPQRRWAMRTGVGRLEFHQGQLGRVEKMKTRVVIIGAGPAGLTAGYLLSKEEVDVVVLEADPVYVGGISRTVTYKGFHFDIGGHRFFSKSKAVEDLWTEILPNDMLVRPR